MRAVHKPQVLIGFIALLVGSLVYLVDRAPEQTYFVDSSPLTISLFPAAIALGAIIAYGVLLTTSKRRVLP